MYHTLKQESGGENHNTQDQTVHFQTRGFKTQVL